MQSLLASMRPWIFIHGNQLKSIDVQGNVSHAVDLGNCFNEAVDFHPRKFEPRPKDDRASACFNEAVDFHPRKSVVKLVDSIAQMASMRPWIFIHGNYDSSFFVKCFN